MNERQFKAKMRESIKPFAYIQSMSSYATNGTPDLWVSGTRGDLWIEVKYHATPQKRSKPTLSALQRKWLDNRYKEGRNVCVVVGKVDGCLIYINGEWGESKSEVVSYAEMIQWIKGVVA